MLGGLGGRPGGMAHGQEGQRTPVGGELQGAGDLLLAEGPHPASA